MRKLAHENVIEETDSSAEYEKYFRKNTEEQIRIAIEMRSLARSSEILSPLDHIYDNKSWDSGEFLSESKYT